MSARRRWAAALTMTVLTLTACTATPPGEVAEPTPSGPQSEPTWPLTGLPHDDGAGDHPALAVKIEETVMTGGGEALVATGGRTVEATWFKEAIADPVTLRTAEGADVTLVPGTTWVELVPVSRGGVELAR